MTSWTKKILLLVYYCKLNFLIKSPFQVPIYKSRDIMNPHYGMRSFHNYLINFNLAPPLLQLSWHLALTVRLLPTYLRFDSTMICVVPLLMNCFGGVLHYDRLWCHLFVYLIIPSYALYSNVWTILEKNLKRICCVNEFMYVY